MGTIEENQNTTETQETEISTYDIQSQTRDFLKYYGIDFRIRSADLIQMVTIELETGEVMRAENMDKSKIVRNKAISVINQLQETSIEGYQQIFMQIPDTDTTYIKAFIEFYDKDWRSKKAKVVEGLKYISNSQTDNIEKNLDYLNRLEAASSDNNMYSHANIKIKDATYFKASADFLIAISNTYGVDYLNISDLISVLEEQRPQHRINPLENLENSAIVYLHREGWKFDSESEKLPMYFLSVLASKNNPQLLNEYRNTYSLGSKKLRPRNIITGLENSLNTFIHNSDLQFRNNYTVNDVFSTWEKSRAKFEKESKMLGNRIGHRSVKYPVALSIIRIAKDLNICQGEQPVDEALQSIRLSLSQND